MLAVPILIGAFFAVTGFFSGQILIRYFENRPGSTKHSNRRIMICSLIGIGYNMILAASVSMYAYMFLHPIT